MFIIRIAVQRLIDAIPVLLLVSLGISLLVTLIPGDPAITLAGGQDASPERIAELRDQLHLNDPLLVQYLRWIGSAVTGDFGSSILTGRPVMPELLTRLPVTLAVVAGAAIVGLVVGGVVGTLSGLRPGTKLDATSRVGLSLGVAIPNFWLGPLLVIVFAVGLGWFPASGYTTFSDSPWGWFQHLILPWITLGLVVASFVGRQLRSSLIGVMGSNYVRTMWAKGARTPLVLKHSLRNASAPALSVFGVQLSTLVGGTVIAEQIFGIPGLGTYLLSAILNNDMPIIQGSVILFVLLQLIISFVVEVGQGFLNPKIRSTS